MKISGDMTRWKSGVLFVVSVWVVFCVSPLRAQNDVLDKLKGFFNNIAAYNQQYTQEKVYLHLDNNGYFPGETIWFKAYVVGAATLLPTDMSKVLYVELLTPEGEVLQRKKYPVINGRTCGEFHLENIVHTGYYEVRAYTRAMLNWDAAYVFSRVIPIYDTPKDSLQYGEMTMYEIQNEKDKAFQRPVPSVSNEENTVREGKMMMTFYPEGGYITQGVSSRVAFKITDAGGTPLSASVRLLRTDKSETGKTRTVHEGMGMLYVPSDWNGGYAEVTDASGAQALFSLPSARKTGCDIATHVDTVGNLVVTSKSNASFPSQILGISVVCRGVPCYFDTISVSSLSERVKTIPYRQLRDGVHQVSLFTSQGELLSERLVWITPHRKPLQLSVAQNEKVYKAFSPIVLDFTLSNAQGNPVKGEFSLSVRDVDGDFGLEGEGMSANLLLASDLKGYIHRPEYYFSAQDKEHLHALDLLLMVQGYRRYAWEEMSGVRPFVLKQPVEDGLLVDGRIVGNGAKHEGKGNVDVNLMVMLGKTFVSGDTRTASDGSFALLAPDFYGEGIGYFTTMVNGKRKSCNVALNRGFSPPPASYNPLALSATVSFSPSLAEREEPELFQWVDTLPRIVQLPEVGVKEKWKLHPYGSRFTWMGGESAGKRYATLYYNVEDALEKLLDKGEREGLIWDWLAKVNPNLTVEASDVNPRKETQDDPILTYKGAPVVVLTDNDLPIDDINYFMSEIRSLVICEQPDAWMRLNPSRMTDARKRELLSCSRTPVTILLYTRVDNSLVQYRKGQRITPVHGYSKYEEFYSPDYRTMNAPTPTDVRRTLYWNPNVVTDEKGKAQVLFFGNSRKQQRIRVDAQGISATGQFFSCE